MSLNSTERARTAAELSANLTASGLTMDELRTRTGLGASRLEAALAVRMANPADVWLVRDVLEAAVKENGGEFTPFSVLTDDMRAAAAAWFGIRDKR